MIYINEEKIKFAITLNIKYFETLFLIPIIMKHWYAISRSICINCQTRQINNSKVKTN